MQIQTKGGSKEKSIGGNSIEKATNSFQNHQKKNVRTYGYHFVNGKSNHAMEDHVVSNFKQVDNRDVVIFAIFDSHLGHDVANYLQTHFIDNMLKEHNFWTDTESAIRRAYNATNAEILEKGFVLGEGGSTAVIAILIDGYIVVANVGDSKAVICKNGVAKQLSVDHEPSKKKNMIESHSDFVSNLSGDVPLVDEQLAVARDFGDKSLKIHLFQPLFFIADKS